jgi:parallel beta-helix repeat protein
VTGVPISSLPDDWQAARLIGRVETEEGPTPVLIEGGLAYDMSRVAPTVSALIANGVPPASTGRLIGPIDDVPPLLSPVDLQCIKAAGVTFAVSAIERVIEERARGDSDAAAAVRGGLEARIGGSIRSVVPGSPEAAALKAALIDDGMWSHYLEVAIGPDAEVFTKGPPLSSVGHGAEIGIRSDSTWNNPEPEVVLIVDPAGRAVGATLGNDVNLRDFEGRSALLLGKAKDNNASCALGPFIRLFDEHFTIDDVRTAEITLRIEGSGGYVLEGRNAMSQISRDPLDLVAQTLSQHHYPDGFALFCGTLFAPTQDRDEPGRGFTHKVGDVVTIANPKLGRLVNRVVHCNDAAPWTFGIGALMTNLARRGLLAMLVLATAMLVALPSAAVHAAAPALSLTANYVDTVVDTPVEGNVGADMSRGPVTFAVSIPPLYGKVTMPKPGTDQWRYVPAKGRVGPDRFQITVTRGSETSLTKIVVLTTDAPTRKTWIVDATTGKDSNPGSSEAAPFQTIQAAANVTRPGDTVLIKNGTYLEQGPEGVVHIKRSGAPGAFITYKAFPGHKPVLKTVRGWNHVLITGSWIKVIGLTIEGNARVITRAQSEEVYTRFLDPKTRTWGPETSYVNTNGIMVRPENSTAPMFERIAPRRIEILGNTVSHVPGGGIATDMADWITIAYNTVHDTAYRSVFANSGISIFHPFDTDGDYASYKNVIRNNIAYANRSEIKWFQVQRISDGNGIIYDDTRNTQIKGIPYKGRALIANNLVFDNGGAGIQTYSSDNVDIVHNTAYGNTKSPELDWGQILARVSSNIRILNNIIVADPGKRMNENDRTTDTLFDYNLYFGGRKPDVMGKNDRIADPMFVGVSGTDRRDFRLAKGSPAIDSGVAIDDLATDIVGKARPNGQRPDRGAFEYREDPPR